MADIVVDANVWIVADRLILESISVEEEDCIRTCRSWLHEFVEGDDRLLVDWTYRILSEYRNNLRKGGFAEPLLNQLEAQPVRRFARVDLEFDRNGNAVLPTEIEVGDPSDRKYVAVALQREPFAPIYVASDRGWERDRPGLSDYGLVIHQLCPDLHQSTSRNAI